MRRKRRLPFSHQIHSPKLVSRSNKTSCDEHVILYMPDLCRVNVAYKIIIDSFSGVAKGRPGGPGQLFPILQTKHKHTFKLHEIDQFSQFKIIEIAATRSYF